MGYEWGYWLGTWWVSARDERRPDSHERGTVVSEGVEMVAVTNGGAPRRELLRQPLFPWCPSNAPPAFITLCTQVATPLTPPPEHPRF